MLSLKIQWERPLCGQVSLAVKGKQIYIVYVYFIWKYASSCLIQLCRMIMEVRRIGIKTRLTYRQTLKFVWNWVALFHLQWTTFKFNFNYID